MPSKLFAPGLLTGQVALVTGGGSGLGRATALELAACGAQVVVCGRRPEPLEETVGLCEDGALRGARVRHPRGGPGRRPVDGVLERHGRIDVLVNNAGGQYMTPPRTSRRRASARSSA